MPRYLFKKGKFMTQKESKNLPESPKKELNDILNYLELKGDEISNGGREFIKAGQFMSDFANATRSVLPYLSFNSDAEYMIDDLDDYKCQADRLVGGIKSLSENFLSTTSSTGGSAVLSVTSCIINQPLTISNSFSRSPKAQDAINSFFAVTNRMIKTNDVEELLMKFGLQNAGEGRKSPLHLFKTAHSAFENPVIKGNPTSTSLIPMRECIRLVIDTLLKQRPTQEKTKTELEKIRSIGRQLKKDDIGMDTLESLAQKWCGQILDKDLSSAKEQDFSREEWSLRLQRATQFLFSLLSGLDATKMRNYK